MAQSTGRFTRAGRSGKAGRARMTGRARWMRIGALAVLTVMLSACGGAEALGGGEAPRDAIVVGSGDYYSNEIIAEVYAQALEDAGFTVSREFKIGAREVYLGEVESGVIDVFPEYTGPLLQYWNPDNAVTDADAIYAELTERVPAGLQILNQAEATDQDSYVVSRAFSEKTGITSLADLASYDGPLTVGSNSEFENRPNGPKGLKKHYGVDVGFTPIEDKGGPLTVKALLDGQIELANVFSASPAIQLSDLVVLDDPEGMFLASHVVPLASIRLDPDAVRVINDVQARLDSAALIGMNVRSVEGQEMSAAIAARWLSQNR